MRQIRFILFVFAILFGAAGGLYYGWSVNPQGSQPGTLENLRRDFHTDYVLMTAEAFQADPNPALAAQRLAALGKDSPARLVQQAIINAGELNYSVKDIDTLARLSQVLLTWNPTPTAGKP
jgi:hypothetical protein